MKYLIQIVCFVLLTSSALAKCLLSGYSANYTFYDANMKAIGTHQENLQLTSPDQYTIKNSSNLSILWFTENLKTTVIGNYKANQFIPKSYYFHESRKNSTISFAPKDNKYDALSYILNLRAALLTNQAKFNHQIQYTHNQISPIIKVNPNHLLHAIIKTDIGTLKTVFFSYTNAQNITTRYWLAPQYAYLPVEIAGYKNNKMLFAQRIKSIAPSNSIYCAIK